MYGNMLYAFREFWQNVNAVQTALFILSKVLTMTKSVKPNNNGSLKTKLLLFIGSIRLHTYIYYGSRTW